MNKKSIIKIVNVVGARPNFMKIAPLVEEMQKYSEIKFVLVHTGQHYDNEMYKLLFNDLELPKPNFYLSVGPESHAKQTAKIMNRFEDVVIKEKPDLVLIVGDVNSTLACSLVASKLGISVAHIEAGLRSFNWRMPEEINRVITDRLSDYLFTTEQSANRNLLKEGINKKKIYFVGNVMIDTLKKHLEKSRKSNILDKLNLQKKEYAVLTMHRQENVDNNEKLKDFFKSLSIIQEKIKIVYPMHPRTKKNLEKFKMMSFIKSMKNFILTKPLGYLDFINLMNNANFVMTDSGGIQEETTVLGIPCITIRKETERPVTVINGTNIIAANNKKMIEESFRILNNRKKIKGVPSLWDGKAAGRIVKILLKELKQ